MMDRRWKLTTLLSLLVLIQGCSTLRPSPGVDGATHLERPQTELAEEQLLDVWIELFDPGELPDDADDAMGLSLEIREAEARYLAEQLRETMESTGYWGAVRLVPRDTAGSELLVRGTIVASDGEQLALQVSASDATGREWFRRDYQGEAADPGHRRGPLQGVDPFQSLYNRIANDLAEYRGRLGAFEITEIRRVAELRFAADLAPDAFDGYLDETGGRYRVLRLPAEDDPMYRRVRAIRERDQLLIDTLNGHFGNFARQMEFPYAEWRSARSEEAASLRRIEREAMQRKVLGAAAIIGAIAIEAAGNGRYNTGVLRDVLVLGGAYSIKTGIDKSSETGIHREAIIELDESFSSEAGPMVVEVDGETHELTGSAETQYAKWRALLKDIYASETGLGAR
jgi:hypothetical protein